MSIPNRASDAGPDAQKCPGCGEYYMTMHDCPAYWDWRDWMDAARDNLKAAERGCKGGALPLIEKAEEQIRRAKQLL